MSLYPYYLDGLFVPESKFAERHAPPSPVGESILTRLRSLGVALAMLLFGE